MPPSDADISFKTGEENATCLSFSPDGKRLLVSLEDEVQIWNIETRQKEGQVPSMGCLETSFSADGELVIIGDSYRMKIWDSAGKEVVVDTAVCLRQTISLSEAKHAIRTCGPSTHRMWPSSFGAAGASSCSPQSTANRTVENINNFVSYHCRPSNLQFCEDVSVQNVCGFLTIFR